MTVEGVIKFRAAHTTTSLPEAAAHAVTTLLGWRDLLFQLRLLGMDPNRYGGAAWGNVSARIGPFPGERAARPFVVSGTQTSGKAVVDREDFAVVTAWDVRKNSVVSRGPARPSSESMTHGAVYDLSPTIRAVLHVHSPRIFDVARALELPCTAPGIDYGTVEMANEVARLWRSTSLPERRVLVMLGHEDGVVAFGRDVDDAGSALMTTLAAASALRQPGHGLRSA